MRWLTALLATNLALGAEPAEYVQLLPAGEFAARDGRLGEGKTWKVDDVLGARLAAEFTATARRTPIVIDYDHHTLYVATTGVKAVAAAWMSGAEWRPGKGLFAKTEWTAAAAQHIRNREYGFISPVLLYDEDTLEVKGVALAGLVNYPALLGMEPVLTQLATQFPQENTMNPILAALLSGLGLPETATQEQASTALAALLALKTKPAAPVVPAALATALKLPAGADEAAALAAVQVLLKPDASGLAAMAALQGEVATLRKQVEGDKVKNTVDAAVLAGKLIPAQRDWAIALGEKDFAALSTFLASAPVMTLTGQSGGRTAADGGAGDHAATALHAHVAGLFGFTPAELAAKPKQA
jgi:phage I-like protein